MNWALATDLLSIVSMIALFIALSHSYRCFRAYCRGAIYVSKLAADVKSGEELQKRFEEYHRAASPYEQNGAEVVFVAIINFWNAAVVPLMNPEKPKSQYESLDMDQLAELRDKGKQD